MQNSDLRSFFLRMIQTDRNTVVFFLLGTIFVGAGITHVKHKNYTTNRIFRRLAASKFGDLQRLLLRHV